MRYAIRWFKCKLKPPKNPVFGLDPIRPYLDLSPERIFDLQTHLQPFQIRLEDKSTKFDFDVNFIIEPSTVEKIVMHLWMLQCVLYKSSTDTEPLSATLHGVNTCFIHQPPKEKVKILDLTSIFSKRNQLPKI